MKAVTVADFGTPPTLQEVPAPEPGESEVQVKVNASSLNGFDLAVVNGYLKGMMEHRFPVVLGKDFAGTVEATGPNVASVQVGDRVFGVVMKPALGDGAFGEYVTSSEKFVARTPETLDDSTVGVLGLAGAAAVDMLNALDVAEGSTVLISGATGGVGVLVIQMAAQRGARVIATAKPEDSEIVRQLGAHEVVDYTGDLTAAVRAIRPEGVDAVVHLAGDGLELAKLLVPGGRIASAVGFTAEQAPELDVHVIPVMAAPVTATLEQVAADVASGKLTVPVQETYPLPQVPQAFADFASGKVGKIAIAVA